MGGQLSSLAVKLFGSKFRGIYVKGDKLPILKEGEILIQNNPTNIHWIGVANVKGTRYEFDSFGRDMLGNAYTDYNTPTDNVEDQRIWEANCGQRTLAFFVTVMSK